MSNWEIKQTSSQMIEFVIPEKYKCGKCGYSTMIMPYTTHKFYPDCLYKWYSENFPIDLVRIK